MVKGDFVFYRDASCPDVCFMGIHDSAPVILESTAFGEEVERGYRRDANGERQEVEYPRMLLQYNRFMGGVDLFDQKRSYYSVDRRSSKWWKKIFYFCVEAAMVNSFILRARTFADNRDAQIFRAFQQELALRMMAPGEPIMRPLAEHRAEPLPPQRRFPTRRQRKMCVWCYSSRGVINHTVQWCVGCIPHVTLHTNVPTGQTRSCFALYHEYNEIPLAANMP